MMPLASVTFQPRLLLLISTLSSWKAPATRSTRSSIGIRIALRFGSGFIRRR
ncbi:MAG: hypothetical protein WCP58_06605 [bacterium]